jgi:hypothetical protein
VIQERRSELQRLASIDLIAGIQQNMLDQKTQFRVVLDKQDAGHSRTGAELCPLANNPSVDTVPRYGGNSDDARRPAAFLPFG